MHAGDYCIAFTIVTPFAVGVELNDARGDHEVGAWIASAGEDDHIAWFGAAVARWYPSMHVVQATVEVTAESLVFTVTLAGLEHEGSESVSFVTSTCDFTFEFHGQDRHAAFTLYPERGSATFRLYRAPDAAGYEAIHDALQVGIYETRLRSVVPKFEFRDEGEVPVRLQDKFGAVTFGARDDG